MSETAQPRLFGLRTSADHSAAAALQSNDKRGAENPTVDDARSRQKCGVVRQGRTNPTTERTCSRRGRAFDQLPADTHTHLSSPMSRTGSGPASAAPIVQRRDDDGIDRARSASACERNDTIQLKLEFT